MSAPNEYRITVLADFLSVPAEKQAECLRDFGHWLMAVRNSGETNEVMSAAFGAGVSLSPNGFTWIDDGIEGASAIDFMDSESGETVRLPLRAAQTGGAA